MNSLYTYYNNVQKMAAYKQAKRMQRGVKLGYGEPISSATKFSMPSGAYIGTSDFSIEYYGNSVGSISNVNYFISTIASTSTSAGILMWNREAISVNGVDAIRMGNNSDGTPNTFYPNWKSDDDAARFHLVLTRSQTNIRVRVNNDTFEYETKEVLDLGNLQLVISNSSDVGFVRVWNYALSADDVTSHFNNGDPMGYVVPKAKRDGLLVEYLPQNLMYGQDDKTIATSWLDSAKQLPLSDEYMEPLFQSIGGYDMAANGTPEILYLEYDYQGTKLGYEQSITDPSADVFVSKSMPIGTSDFSIEFYGNTYGSYRPICSSIFNHAQTVQYEKGYIAAYQSTSGAGGIDWVLFEKSTAGDLLADSINLRYKPIDPIEKFHFVITRQGLTVKVYINGELKTTKEQSEVKDMGDLQLAIANSSDVGFVRVWNKSLSDSEVSQLENSGDPAGYVLPAEMKTGDQRCIAEYLPMNLLPQKYKPTVAGKWLDSATVLPDPDGTLRRIWKSVGGYDMTANGNPIILQ